MSLAIEDFKAKLVGGGARQNLFKVLLTYPGVAGGNTELTSFMAKGASLPASTVPEVIVPFRGRQIKVAGDRTFEPITLTIINGIDFAVRNSVERWLNAINQHEAGVGLTTLADYQSDMEIQQLDRQNNVLKSYFIKGAFPTTMSNIELAYDTNDQVEDFTVEFSYQYWTSNTTS